MPISGSTPVVFGASPAVGDFPNYQNQRIDMKRILCLLPLFALVACDGNREDRSKVLAKIAGTSYTQSDFEFMLKTMSSDRQAEIMKDPEARRKQFNFMLKQKLQ